MKKNMNAFSAADLRVMANAARCLAIDQIQTARSGHPGIALGAADIMTTLFANHLRFNPNTPNWSERDRFVLSAGHGSALLYAVLHLAGYAVSVEDLKRFRTLGARTQGHPELGTLPGIECTTGALGQGLATAVGMAMAEKIRRERGETRDGWNTYVLASDGDLMEGVSQEAISFAGHHKLNRLIVMWDNNGISTDGAIAMSDDIPNKFIASGWAVVEINGMSPREIDRALTIAKKSARPVLIACKTQIGYLSANAGTAAAHSNALTDEDAENVYAKLGRDAHAKFTVNADAAILWETLRESKITADADVAFVSAGLNLTALPPADNRAMSGREMFNIAMERIMTDDRAANMIIGGSADLTPSNGTFVAQSESITPDDARGNYIHYGIREHVMAAIMNGLALSGMRPYGGTFLAFSDYMRGAMRMTAMMNLPVIYVLTHDSIAIGEDGATGQPVEQLNSIRMIPNMSVWRPASLAETTVALQAALNTAAPTSIVLSRQPLSAIGRAENIDYGGYILSDAARKHSVTLCASGSEVELALSIQRQLADRNIGARVVSVPNLNLFMSQDADYVRDTIGDAYAVLLEAAVPGYTGDLFDSVFALSDFGTSGPGDAVYNYFGLDAENLAAEIARAI